MTHHQPFRNGFFSGLSIFILLNILAAHLLSDCGLGAVLKIRACTDDIVRVGFPFVFFEEGGFAFHSSFQSSILTFDLILGIGFSLLIGFLLHIRQKKETSTISS